MIPSKAMLLGSLPPYKDGWITVVEGQQSIPDIVDEVLNAHLEFADYYDSIALYFDADDIKTICDKLQSFCVNEIAYREETEEDQTSTLPAGLLERGFGDCKHYAGFCAGVLDALNRYGHKIKWKYRFASYRLFSPSPHHVFVVVFDKGKEIWIDPTPNQFDKQPIWITDKKISAMAIRRNISGIYDDFENVDYDRPPVWLYGQWYVFNKSARKVGSFDLSSIMDFGQSSGSTSLAIATGDIPGIISSGTSLIQNISSIFSGLFGGSKECNAYPTLTSMFPVTNTKDANSVMSALTGLYNHYKVEKWVVDRSVTATRCWPEAYEQYFKELIALYNSLVGYTALTFSKNPPTERNGIMSITATEQKGAANTGGGGATSTTGGFDFGKILLYGGGAFLALKVFKVI